MVIVVAAHNILDAVGFVNCLPLGLCHLLGVVEARALLMVLGGIQESMTEIECRLEDLFGQTKLTGNKKFRNLLNFKPNNYLKAAAK